MAAVRLCTVWDWVSAIGFEMSAGLEGELNMASRELANNASSRDKVVEILQKTGNAVHKCCGGVSQEKLYALLKGLKQYHGVKNVKASSLAKSICNPTLKVTKVARGKDMKVSTIQPMTNFFTQPNASSASPLLKQRRSSKRT